VQPRIYLPSEIDFTYSSLAIREEPRKVFMVRPDYFNVIDVKNPYMEKNLSGVDQNLAKRQWQDMFHVYIDLQERGILKEVVAQNGLPECEDMVFCANQSLPWQVDGRNTVVMSRMKYPSRQAEVPAIAEFYASADYDIRYLQSPDFLEGNGDVIPHPGRQLLWAGHGLRSGSGALEEVAGILQVPLVPLRLVSEYFYHLDTCFVPLSDSAVMLCREAFDEASLAAIGKVFEKVYPVSAFEAIHTFSLNAHCMSYPEAKVAILQKGSEEVKKILLQEDYLIYEVDTSEFMKSGGSVFCMKMMFY
jgi:N-dimethylarginine dimethylaminohydrolase